MRLLLLLLARRLAALRHLIRERQGAQLAVLGGFALLFALIMVGVYVLLRRTFSVMARDLGTGGPALTLYTLESFLVLVWLVALLSFVVSGLWIFYRASDTPLLLSTPLPLTTLYWLRTTETFTLTSWAFVMLAIPGLVALGVSHGSGWGYYLRALAVLVVFMAFTGGSGALLTVLAGVAFRRLRSRSVLLLVGILVLGSVALLVGRHVVPSRADFTAIFQPGLVNGKPQSIKFIETKFSFWPSHPFAVALYAAATGRPAGSQRTRLALGLGPLLAVAAAALLGCRLYRHTLPVVAEGLVFAGGLEMAVAPRGQGRFPRFSRGPVGCLLERDLLRLSRSPRELGQATLLLFLLGLYVAFLIVAPLREASDQPETVAWLLSLNLVTAGYVLTAFGLRFVFPSLSVEGKAAWVLFASPVRLFRLFIAKLAVYTILLFALVGSIALAGTLPLSPSPPLFGAFSFLLALVAVTTVAISLAFGVLWPNFTESSPDRLTTSAGGLATTFLCLGYVAVMGWLAQRSALLLFDGGSPVEVLLLGLAVSAAIAGSVIGAARRRIIRVEVA